MQVTANNLMDFQLSSCHLKHFMNIKLYSLIYNFLCILLTKQTIQQNENISCLTEVII